MEFKVCNIRGPQRSIIRYHHDATTVGEDGEAGESITCFACFRKASL